MEIELARSGDRSDGEKRVLGYELQYPSLDLKVTVTGLGIHVGVFLSFADMSL